MSRCSEWEGNYNTNAHYPDVVMGDQSDSMNDRCPDVAMGDK